MLTQQQRILNNLLKCGSADLSQLEDIQYDLDDMIDNLLEFDNLSLNSLYGEVFEKGIEELKNLVEQRIKEYTEEAQETTDADNLEWLNSALKDLSKLDPENDVDYFCNCLDTHIFFDEHKDTYREYFRENDGGLEDIETNMGFDFNV